jgi:hypothetical protein
MSAAKRYIIVGEGALYSTTLGYAPKTRSVGIMLLGLAELLIALKAI